MASLNDMKKKNLQNTKEYKNLYEIAITVSEDLASNNLEQVKKIVNKWASLFGKSGTHMDYDDFLSFANMERVVIYILTLVEMGNQLLQDSKLILVQIEKIKTNSFLLY